MAELRGPFEYPQDYPGISWDAALKLSGDIRIAQWELIEARRARLGLYPGATVRPSNWPKVGVK